MFGKIMVIAGLVGIMLAADPGKTLEASEMQDTASPGGHPITLDSGKLKITFTSREHRLILTDLSNTEGWQWIAPTDDIGHLWKLAFLGPGGVSYDIGSGDVEFTDSQQSDGAVSLLWNVPLGDDAARVQVSVRCPAKSGLSYWSLKATLPDGWKVTRADFPLIPNIRLHRGLKLAAPAGWGVEYAMKPGVGYGGTYPSCSAVMQFVAFYSRGRGLYVGMHDREANHKILGVHAREDVVQFTCTNRLAIPAHAGGDFQIPFEAVIGVFDGNYYDAAQIYREFTFTTEWGKCGPVSKRPIPQWVKDTDLWLRPRGTPEDNLEITKEALRYFDVRTACHWYDWHVIPYDTLYPEYFPAKPGFAEAVKELQDMGTHVMPYINGRLCDPNSTTWNDEQGYKSAARKENGDPYTEIYGSKVPLNVMCPYTRQWQTKIVGLVDRLINEIGVHGVYIDQIGCAHAVECFDGSHGHPVGGGHFWVTGYRKLLDMVRARLPKDRMITTEENIECFVDQFDALLLVNTPSIGPTPIPLWPAVYSGRVINFAFMYIPADDLEKSLPWRLKMARCFLYGAQLGWIQPRAIMAPEVSAEAEFLRNLARCRSKAHEFLVYGRFLGMVPVKGDNPRLKGWGSGSFGGSYPIDTPAVIASSWESEDGRRATAIVNMSDDERKVVVAGREVAIPARDALVIEE